MEIICAKTAGFCFGVERAIRLAQDTVQKQKKKVFTFGPLIHNPQEVGRLEKKGIVSIECLEDIKKWPVIIRSHGIAPQDWREIKRKKLQFVDATCPFVLKTQRLAQKLHEDGYFVVVIGEKNHPEVKNIIGYAKKAVAIQDLKDIENIPKGNNRIGVVCQTTQPLGTFIKITNALLLKYRELKIFNTICKATTERQEEAESIARKTDVMLVIGGRNSANTTHLAEICRDAGACVHHIETEDEIRREWFKRKNRIGITAGASTPDWVIKGVMEKVKGIIN